MNASNVQPLPDMQPAPPHNAEIEAALLGAILTNDRAYDSVADIIGPEHFYEPVHGRIFEAAARLIDEGREATPRTLQMLFEKDEALDQAGGSRYLYDLAASVISVINVVDYGHIIHDLWMRRQLISVFNAAVDATRTVSLDDGGATDIVEAVEEQLAALGAGPAERRSIAFGDAVERMLAQAEAAYKHDGHTTGLSSGLVAMDRHLGGLQKGEITIVAGRPSMGKTALATTIAYNAARAGRRVLFFSLEMPADQLALRVQSALTRIPATRIRCGDLDKRDWDDLIARRAELTALPLMIDDTDTMTVTAMRARARREQRRGGIDLIVVDYLQLIQPSQSSVRNDNRTVQITEISRDLKRMAKALDVPVMALSQLSRQVESRDDKRPTLADLRESGAIEQDADVVLFVYRHHYYVAKSDPVRGPKESDAAFDERWTKWSVLLAQTKGKADAICAKQRQGPTGTIHLLFDDATTWFSDREQDRQEDML